jgi:hypothetical protein
MEAAPGFHYAYPATREGSCDVLDHQFDQHHDAHKYDEYDDHQHSDRDDDDHDAVAARRISVHDDLAHPDHNHGHGVKASDTVIPSSS